MPGEHWCTVCENSLRKLEDPYLKIRWKNWVVPETADVVAVVCPVCQGKDEKLSKLLNIIHKRAKKPQKSRVIAPCSFCDKKIKKKERSIRVEWYNTAFLVTTRKPKEELHATACNKCIDKEGFEGIRVIRQNPNFKLQINCLSTQVCSSFKDPKRNRGINCQNVVINMEGVAYCRRAHPGHVRLYREKWAFPPSQRTINKFFRDYMKTFKPLFAYMEERYNFKNIEEARKQGLEERKIAEAFLIPIAEEVAE